MAASSSSRYSPSSSFNYAFKYDVFLSFRGEDTRHGFTGHLYNNLCNRGIHTFFDKEELRGGEVTRESLVQAIQESRIAILVISINYASSSFCLDELATIIKRRDLMLVLPVFYKVEPSQLRHQTGTVGEALAKLEERFRENKEKVLNWREALHQVADLSGYHYNDGNEYEYELIGKIIDNVSKKINRTLLHVANYPVGLDLQLLELRKLLDLSSNEVTHMVGILGHGGLGKTTLALAMYNLIADHFEGVCFLRDVRENSERYGLHYLQESLLSKLVGEKELKLTSFNDGIPIIKHRLQLRKILLILDDVDKLQQLQALAGAPDWFGPGSRVIITTRNQQLLAHHNVTRIHRVKKLNSEDALQLLSWNAFKSEEIDPTLNCVLNRVANYCAGLPLALEVIGSSLYGKNIREWESAIKRYEKYPNDEILQKLKVSYDALGDLEKSIFLDIACCFKGYDLEMVKRILHARYDYSMEHPIGVLIDRCLIKINRPWYGGVTLHDLIEDMGKGIVQQESLKVAGKRSRLWFHEDIVQVLSRNKGSENIEMIFLQFPFSEETREVKWNGDGFEKMENLEILIIKNGHFSRGPTHLPNSLRVLEWNGYPSQYLPFDFCPESLAIFNLSHGQFSSDALTDFSLKPGFTCVKVLRFNKCPNVTHIPDVSSFINLEELSFSFCRKLSTIHESVGSLDNLKILDAEYCHKLRSFPSLMLPSLEKLELSGCRRLESFPEILGKMEHMRELNISGTRITELPPSFRNLTGLRSLSRSKGDCPLNGASFFNPNIITMPQLAHISAYLMNGWVFPEEDDGGKIVSSNIQSIHVIDCNLTDEFFLVLTRWFGNVKELTIYNEDLIIIPECVKELRFLETMCLNQCGNLLDMEGIPPKLEYFEADGIPSNTPLCRSTLLNQELHKAGNTMFIFPGDVIPEWFEHRSSGTSISFWFRNKLPHLVLCLLLTYSAGSEECPHLLELFLDINGTIYISFWYGATTYHTYLFGLKKVIDEHNLNEALSKNEWNRATVICLQHRHAPVPGLTIEGGFNVLEQENSMQDIRFTNPFTVSESQNPDNVNEDSSLCYQPR